MNFGKTIRLFLVDGTSNGLITAELSNWTGIGVKVPRIKVKEYSKRNEFQKPGVYILIGKGENNEDASYIGEAEVIFDRLQHHIAKKEFWNEVIFFSSKDKYLNKASVKYLESRLHELAQLSNRYAVIQNIPTRPELSEAEQAELEEFLSNIKILTSALGHKIFESVEETVQDPLKEEIYTCSNGAGAYAKGKPSTEGFLIYQGAQFIALEQKSLSTSIIEERSKMLNTEQLIPMGDFYELTKNYITSSPSRAASMILARSASGPLEWKTDKGVQLKQMEK
ncbi:GIY-YIG nuclease family protein [Anditalea andensis]|uniref:Methionine sulfoxide reductase n=1 Tax=Anditalea andensis TaxID=1048983 RepID=A0A074KX90_9BACT|nr:GIY-YIG nuclease family protein [Anditalea andensis]KEO72228.1 methionine sulfoxide reductase [Anditalea andensis]